MMENAANVTLIGGKVGYFVYYGFAKRGIVRVVQLPDRLAAETGAAGPAKVQTIGPLPPKQKGAADPVVLWKEW